MTPEGVFLASYSPAGLCRLEFPLSQTQNDSSAHGAAAGEDLRDWHDLAADAVAAVLAGEPPRAMPPLDLSAGTDFQRRVWAALQCILPGHTCSYAEIAAIVGAPRATRAVGQACGANPIPLLIPCHRVLASGNKLGGFSGGLHWKRLLLAREQPVDAFKF